MNAIRCTVLSRAFPLALAFVGLVLCLPAEAQVTRTWVGIDGDMSVAGNWLPAGIPSTSAGDLMRFDGSSTQTVLTFPATTFNGNAGLGHITIASGQVDPLSIDNTGGFTGSSVFRFRPNANLAIESGAGAFSMGTGGNGFYLNLANHANGNRFTNNSGNLATFGPQTIFNASGGTGGYAIFDGAGDWRVEGNITGAITRGVIKNGTGTLTMSGQKNYPGGTTVNGGILEFVTGNAMDNARGGWTVHAGATLRAVSAQNVYGGLTLNGGELAGIGGHSYTWGHFVLGSNVTVGGSRTSVISAAVRIASNADRTFTVNPTGDPSGIDLDVLGDFSHAHNHTWGFMTKAGEGTMRFAPGSFGNIGRITVNAGKVLFDDVIQSMTNGGLINNAGGTVEVRQSTGVNVAFNQRVQGAGTFIKSGPGTFQFNGGGQLIAQGQFLIQEGTLQNNNNSVNWSGNTGNVDISAGAVLDLYADPIYLNNLTGSGVVQNNYGNGSGYSGSSQYIEKLVVGVAGGSSTFDGTIRDNATGAGLAGGTGRGGIELEKRGAGTFTLANTNTYTGATTISGGTLRLENPGAAMPSVGGLVAHWDAAAITGVADGARLDTWADSAGGTHDAARQGGTPVYLEDGGSGVPVVRFETSGDSWYSFPGIDDIRTVFFVGKELQPGSSRNYFLGHSGSYHFHRGNDDMVWHSGYAHGNIRSGQTHLDGQQVNGTATTFGAQSVKLLSLVTTGNVQANRLSRDRNIGGRSWRGDIGEILVFNQALSAADRLAVERYLMSKWFGVLPSATAVSLTNAGAALDLNGVNQTIGSLSGVAGSQVLLGGGTLTVGKNNTTTTFAGVLADGAAPGGGLTKHGSGVLTLAGDASNTFTGPTMVQSGRLHLDKTGGAYAVGGDVFLTNNDSPYLYTTQDNQFAAGSVLHFDGTSGNARVELLGTTQAVAGIVDGTGRGVIQHREHIDAGLAVDTLSTLVLNGSDSYSFNGYLRDFGGGTTALVKEGSGTQTLSGGNISYTGPTTIQGGTLVLNTPNFITYQGGDISIDNGATLRITRSGGDNRFDFNNKTAIFGDSGGGTVDTTSGLNFVVYGGSVFRTTGGPRSNIIGASGINLHNNDSVIFDVARGSDPTSDLTVSTNLWNSGGVVKTGNGILTLAGNNTYTGATTIDGGVLNLHIPGGAHHTYTGGTVSINNGSTLQISRSGGANQYWFNGKTFQFGDTGGGTIDTTSGMNVVVYGGSVFRTAGGDVNHIVGASGINLHNSDTITFDVARGTDPTSDLTVSTLLWNGGGVIKTGDGIATLTGANTYRGGTTVDAGTLLVNNTTGSGTGSGAVAVNNTATLGGTGSIAGTVTINAGGMHAPGASVGSQTVVGGETWMPGGRFEFEINDALGQPGGPIGWDQLLVGGTLDLTALTAQDPFHIDIVSLAGTTPGDIDNFVATVPYQWPFLRYETLVGEFSADLFSLDSSSFSNPTGRGHFEILQMEYNDADWLAIGYVPEPGTWLLLFAALACGLSLRRRSRR